MTSAAETTLQGALTGGSYFKIDWHMDTFDLKWPKTDATFYTDGWRCRIVWRQSSGMGGTIDNNQQCKKRGADGIGLYRTEFLYLGTNKTPTEEDHYNAYRRVINDVGEQFCARSSM